MKRQLQLNRLGLILMLLAGMIASATAQRGETLAVTAVVTVNSTTDVSDGDTSSIANLIADPGADGVISLREALTAANISGGADTINFAIPGSGVHTIAPASPLPDLNDFSGGTTIDGYSQPGATEATGTTPATLKIVIDGSSAGATNGFNISQPGNVIRGLVINNFERNGIYISSLYGNNNVITGNYIGTDASGATDQGNGWCGIELYDPAKNNTIGGDTPGERNVISGNNTCGVHLSGTGVTSNTVAGNYIGTDAGGTADLGNSQHGVDLYGGAQNNTIGGTAPGERNVISGNDLSGVSIQAVGTMSNTVSGNYIGAGADGATGVGNGSNGIYIDQAANNTIGGIMGNVISGSGANGIVIKGNNATRNEVTGNIIGLDLGGTTVVSNTQYGILVYDGAHTNAIGGTASGEGNVISGNGSDGVLFSGSGTDNNTLYSNIIGLDSDGVVPLGNGGAGVLIHNGAQENTIGGTASGQRNIISGNGQSGVTLRSTDTLSNTVVGNYIGVGFDGTGDLGNAWHGVEIRQGTQNNTIGPHNVIAHSGLDGVDVHGSSTSGHTMTRNSIFANFFGIDLTNGANGGITAPVITTVSGSIDITGTACPGCTVEVFENADNNGEGESYLGSTTATAGGAFTLTVAMLNEAYLTATATDVVSGTSEFSAVFVNRQYVYLPLVLQSSQ